MAINADKWPKWAREIAEAEFAAGRSAPYVRDKLAADAYHKGPLSISQSTVGNWKRRWKHRVQIAELPRDLEDFTERNEARVKLLHDMADYQAERCRRRLLKGSAGTDELERLARLQTALSKLRPAQDTPQPTASEGDKEPDGTSEFMQRLEQQAAKPRRRANKRSSPQNGSRRQGAAKQNADAERSAEDGEAMAVPPTVGVSGEAGGSS